MHLGPNCIHAHPALALAEFDGRVLTLREFDERLARLPRPLRAQYSSVEARRALLEQMVDLEVLADAARRRGVDRRPDVKVRISEILVEEMMNTLFGADDLKARQIADEDVQRYYDAHAAECDPTNGGWYYDDPVLPKTVTLCPASCNTVTADVTGQVNIDVGCKTLTTR